MLHEIKNKPDYASLHCTLSNGESVVAESGALMGMSGGVKMETSMKGGIFAAAKRALGGESVFLNTYTASADGQRVDFAPSTPGDMLHIPMAGNTVMVQRGAYVASTGTVTADAKWGGAKTFFSGEGLFMLKCTGMGDLWIASYGAIAEHRVEGRYIVDTTHVVGFDDSLTFNVRKVGGMKSFFLSAEGLVVEFSGSGRVWFQTRSAPSLAGFLHPFRQVVQKS